MAKILSVFGVVLTLVVFQVFGQMVFPDDDIFTKTSKNVKSQYKQITNISPQNGGYASSSSTKLSCSTSKIKNGAITCVNNKCQIKCVKKYAFPNGYTQMAVNCVDGEWEFDKTDWTEIQPCKPICQTPCQNQGICIEPGRCSCPDNFFGVFCEKKKQFCITPPRLPKNSEIRIQATTCTISCRKGYVFPDRTAVTNMDCIEGQWKPSRPDYSMIPDCEATCTPTCQNGGACISLNVCQCPPDRRGPICQYDINVCNPKERLQFNGIYNCSGDNTELKCKLDCPTNIKFSSTPANQYICKYETGVFLPSEIPQCVIPAGHQLIPREETSQSFTNSNYSTRTKTNKIKKVFYDNDNDDYDDSSYEKIITKIKIKHRKKPKKNRGYYEIETEDEEEEEVSNGIYSMYVSGGSDVMTRTPTGATCMTWNGNKVKTFDGLVYTSALRCSHTLIQDVIDGAFSVIYRTCPVVASRCNSTAVEIIIDNARFTFEVNGNGLEVRSADRKLPLPIQRPEIRARMLGNKLLVQMDSCAITIHWNLDQQITIEATAALWNRTGGLCGTLDQDVSNDLRSKDGTIVKTVVTFVDMWATPTIDLDPQQCQVHDSENLTSLSCTDDQHLEAEQMCSQLISSDKLLDCLKIINKRSFMRTCISDYCSCNDIQNPSKCACNSLDVLASDCQYRGIVFLQGWRNLNICPILCPVGEIYQACGPSFEPYCGSTVNEVNVMCNEGCFCPVGMLRNAGKCVYPEMCPCALRGKVFQPKDTIRKDCNTCECINGAWKCSDETCGARCSAIGDPHYQTFDNKHFNFMGKCSYTLMQTANVSIEAENVACSGQISDALGFVGVDQPSCTKSVTIELLVGNRVEHVKLMQGKDVLVNGVPLQKIPIKLFDGRVKIREASSTVLVVNLYDGLKVWWDGVTNVYIDAPNTYRNQTSGLCGTFNANMHDDFLTPEGDVESSVEAFVNKWRSKETCKMLSNEVDVPHPCQINVENKIKAKKVCSILKSDVFASCQWYVDPEEFYEDCLYDMCACKGQDVKNCLCPVLSAYASLCARQGLAINWRHTVKECAIVCPIGQVFEECGDSCYRSCADMHFGEPCKTSCVEGCRCPFGQRLNDNGECVSNDLCPCMYGGMQFEAGYKEVRPGVKHLELCKCAGSNWRCQQATNDDATRYPPASDKRKECLNDNSKEFSTCLADPPKTCKNMFNYVPVVSVECKSGCVCKRGLVLDSLTQKCIEPEMCGCHHGGKSYQNGEHIKAECNECVCANSTWNCTEKVCPATCFTWGDSHFESFDGKDFDFQGVCSYLLSKGSSPAGRSYAISIQNVLCGSLGVTCSKSVSISILGTESETLTLTANKQLSATTNNMKSMLVYEAGIFTIVELIGMDVQVKWDRGTRVYIKVGAQWRDRLQGLCGNFNGDSEDDLKTPAAGIEASATIFGDSWKLEDNCEKPKDQIDTCEAHPIRKVWAQRQCGILKSHVFQACHSEVNVDRYMRRCIYDSCACDQGGDCECLCTAIAAYAQACSIKSVPIKWRTPTLCPMQCDVKCSEYTPCLSSACPTETCDTILGLSKIDQMCQSESCIEGCQIKPCPVGEIYRNHTYTECVPKSSCKHICKIDGDIIYYEGDVLSSDACHTCHCARGQPMCSGLPCTTKTTLSTTTMRYTTIDNLTTMRPYLDAGICITGWSTWINQDRLDTTKSKTKLKFGDIEPIPDQILLNNLNKSACCLPEYIKSIECRSVSTKLEPKQIGEDVECSLERGLFAKGLVHDYEIRVYCECANKSQSEAQAFIEPVTEKYEQIVESFPKSCDPTVPNVEFPGDCHKFLQCVPDDKGAWKYVEKTCGPATMFHPDSMICDWPLAVQAVRPACGQTRNVAETTTARSNILDQTLCQAGQTYHRDVTSCKATCHYHAALLRKKGVCLSEFDSFELGCVSSLELSSCRSNQVWRDDNLCTDLEHCTCMSKSGFMVKPGNVFKESDCEMCQCIHNEYVCDSSHCNIEVFNTSEHTTKVPRHDDVLIIVDSTNSPPVKCSRTIPLIEGFEPLPDSIFTASSFKDEYNSPKYARFVSRDNPNKHIWMPQTNEVLQYLKISLSYPVSVYGVIIRGSKSMDNYVTSYKMLYSFDDMIYYKVANDGVEQILRGPIDGHTPVESVLGVPIEAKFIRIYPLTWHGAIAMQVELLTCATLNEVKTTVAMETSTPLPTTRHIDAITESPMCDDRMGVENGQLNFDQVIFSSIKSKSVSKGIELLKLSAAFGWSPKLNTRNEYVQIDFLVPRLLTGLVTRGGSFGWVTAFNVKYSLDGKIWNAYEDKQHMVKSFLANFDAYSSRTNYFEKPISLRFLKIIPTSWHETIELKLEPIGCFVAYPSENPREHFTPILNTTCGICEGVEPPPLIMDGFCHCNDRLMWDGFNCVESIMCPCIVANIAYPIGAKYQLSDCSKCICQLGGHAQCTPFECPQCEKGLRSVSPAPCSCSCEPCPEGQVICANGVCISEESWCDGIQDCPDDELNCGMDSVNTTTIKESIRESTTCAIVRCPPGYKKQIQNTFSEIESINRIENVNLDAASINRNISNVLLSQCVKFKCIPITKTPAKYVASGFCPLPQCPSGLTVVMEANNDVNGCNNYKCELIERKESVCNITGRSFTTFDGNEFKYDACTHILVRDGNSKWSVILNTVCNSTNHVCKKEIILKDVLENTNIKITQDMQIFIDNYEYSLIQLQKTNNPKLKPYKIAMFGNTFVLRWPVNGLWMTFNNFNEVKIGLTAKHRSLVNGLCGNFNGIADDDWRSPIGEQLGTSTEFGDSWSIPSAKSSECEEHKCPKDTQAEALKLCNAVKDKSFEQCGQTVDFNRFMEKCLEFACDCIEYSKVANVSSDSTKCKCAVLSKYAIECLAADSDVHLDQWRSVHDCQINCPAGMVFKECFRRRCEPTCAMIRGTVDACDYMPGACSTGCFCPEGKVREGDGCIDATECGDCVCNGIGDSQLITYDTKSIELNGTCSYLLTRDVQLSNISTFEIYLTRRKCNKGYDLNRAHCTRSLDILYGNKIIQIQNDQPTSLAIDGNAISASNYKRDWMTAFLSSKTLNVKLPKIFVELQVTLSDFSFTLKLPSVKYGSSLQGYCGNCNNNPNDDLITNPKGLTLKSSSLLKNATTLQNEYECLGSTVNETCIDINPKDDPCLVVKNKEIFGKCHLIIDPELYVSACQANSKCKSSDACAHINAYAAACSQFNMCIDLSQTSCQTSIVCPSGMTHQSCGCPVTCETHKLTGNQVDCLVPRVTGCVCSNNYVLHNNTCMPAKVCTKCDEIGRIVGDKWQTDRCTECVCGPDGRTKCTVQKCPATKACPDGSVRRVISNSTECCTKFVCDPSLENKQCDQRNENIRCSANQRVKQIVDKRGCAASVCECVPPSECPPLLPVHLFEGESIRTDATGCCPVHEKKCNPAICASKMVQCDEYYIKAIANDNSTCCPNYECVPPKDKCIVQIDGKQILKNVNDMWDSVNPCIQHRCAFAISGSMETVDDVQLCPKLTCPPAQTLTFEASKCCPYCKQTACLFDGIAIQVDANIRSADNCTMHKCSRLNDTFLMTSTVEKCPDIGHCPMHLQYQQGCCTMCKPEKIDSSGCVAKTISPNDTVRMVEKNTKLYGMCRNAQPIIGYAECLGRCESGTRYNKANFKQTKVCDCCQVDEWNTVEVPLACDSGASLDVIINIPKSCKCLACDS